DPQAAVVIIELARGRSTREVRVPLYAVAGARELWLLDVVRGWTEVLRSPWRGAYRSRTLWYPGEALRLQEFDGLEVVAMPAPRRVASCDCATARVQSISTGSAAG